MFDVETTMKELWDNLEFLKKNMQIIMKGIFTEMYAAEGIPYSKKLLQTGKVIEKKYGNYIYRITDTKVRKVYTYLKRWHMLLAEFYDKLIDPISAPKALSLEEYALFYKFVLHIHKDDIEYFEKVLNCVEYDLDEKFLEKSLENRKIKLIS